EVKRAITGLLGANLENGTPASSPRAKIGLQPLCSANARLRLRENFVQLPRRGLTALNFQAPGKKRPLAAQGAIGKGDPVLVAGDKCDVGIADFSPPHFEFAIIHFDPPLATTRTA